MSEPQRIGEILKDSKLLLEPGLKCEQCGKALPYRGRKWCAHCIIAWQRTSPEGEKVIRDLSPDFDGIVPERYLAADLDDLAPAVVKVFEELPVDRGICFWGLPGTGKTHALCAILSNRYWQGYEVARVNYEMLCLQIRDSYKPGSKVTELGIIQPYIDVELLVIEDVGTTVGIGRQESDFSLRTFLVLLDTRLEQCRPTFVSTNKSIEELGRSFDKRIASRLQQACVVVQLVGQDRRIKSA